MRPGLLAAASLIAAPALAGDVAPARLEAVAVYGASATKPKEGNPKPVPSDGRETLITHRQVAEEAGPELRQLADAYTGPELSRRRAEAWRAATQRLVDLSLVRQAAREAGVAVADVEIKAMVQRHMRRAGASSQRQLEEILATGGRSLDDLREDYRTQALVQRYLDEVVKPSPPPSPGEVLRYYADHVAEFASPQEVQLRQIILPKSRFPSRADAEAGLRELWTAIQAGGDFAELARRHSDSAYAQDGGLMPYQAVSSLRSDLQSLVRGVAAGRTLAVQETPEAFAIVRVDGIRQGRPRPSEEVQGEILERMRLDDLAMRRERVVQLIRKRAYVWIADAKPPAP